MYYIYEFFYFAGIACHDPGTLKLQINYSLLVDLFGITLSSISFMANFSAVQALMYVTAVTPRADTSPANGYIFSGVLESAPRLLRVQGPLKEASKFASQISGAVNKKVMELDDDAVSAVDGGVQAWPGAEATVATAAGGVAGGWKPPTSERGMSQELANDVPQELSSTLSIDEQVGLGLYFPQSFPRPIRSLITLPLTKHDKDPRNCYSNPFKVASFTTYGCPVLSSLNDWTLSPP